MIENFFIDGRQNVIEKLIIPKIKITQKFINTELEEKEREEIFRLKQFKKLKYKYKDNVKDDICCICKEVTETEPIVKPKPAKLKMSEPKYFPPELLSEIHSIPGLLKEIDNKQTIDHISTDIDDIKYLALKIKECGLTSISLDELIDYCDYVKEEIENFYINYDDYCANEVVERQVNFEDVDDELNNELADIQAISFAVHLELTKFQIANNKCSNCHVNMSAIQPLCRVVAYAKLDECNIPHKNVCPSRSVDTIPDADSEPGCSFDRTKLNKCSCSNSIIKSVIHDNANCSSKQSKILDNCNRGSKTKPISCPICSFHLQPKSKINESTKTSAKLRSTSAPNINTKNSMKMDNSQKTNVKEVTKSFAKKKSSLRFDDANFEKELVQNKQSNNYFSSHKPSKENLCNCYSKMQSKSEPMISATHTCKGNMAKISSERLVCEHLQCQKKESCPTKTVNNAETKSIESSCSVCTLKKETTVATCKCDKLHSKSEETLTNEGSLCSKEDVSRLCCLVKLFPQQCPTHGTEDDTEYCSKCGKRNDVTCLPSTSNKHSQENCTCGAQLNSKSAPCCSINKTPSKSVFNGTESMNSIENLLTSFLKISFGQNFDVMSCSAKKSKSEPTVSPEESFCATCSANSKKGKVKNPCCSKKDIPKSPKSSKKDESETGKSENNVCSLCSLKKLVEETQKEVPCSCSKASKNKSEEASPQSSICATCTENLYSKKGKVTNLCCSKKDIPKPPKDSKKKTEPELNTSAEKDICSYCSFKKLVKDTQKDIPCSCLNESNTKSEKSDSPGNSVCAICSDNVYKKKGKVQNLCCSKKDIPKPPKDKKKKKGEPVTEKTVENKICSYCSLNKLVEETRKEFPCSCKTKSKKESKSKKQNEQEDSVANNDCSNCKLNKLVEQTQKDIPCSCSKSKPKTESKSKKKKEIEPDNTVEAKNESKVCSYCSLNKLIEQTQKEIPCSCSKSKQDSKPEPVNNLCSLCKLKKLAEETEKQISCSCSNKEIKSKPSETPEADDNKKCSLSSENIPLKPRKSTSVQFCPHCTQAKQTKSIENCVTCSLKKSLEEALKRLPCSCINKKDDAVKSTENVCPKCSLKKSSKPGSEKQKCPKCQKEKPPCLCSANKTKENTCPVCSKPKSPTKSKANKEKSCTCNKSEDSMFTRVYPKHDCLKIDKEDNTSKTSQSSSKIVLKSNKSDCDVCTACLLKKPSGRAKVAPKTSTEKQKCTCQKEEKTCSCSAQTKPKESNCPKCAEDKESKPCCLSQNDQKPSNLMCCKQEEENTCSCNAQAKPKGESKCPTCSKESSKDKANEPCCITQNDKKPSNSICCKQQEEKTCSCNAQAKPKVSNCPTCAKDTTPKDKANEPCCLSQKDQTPSNPICCKQEKKETCSCGAEVKKEESKCPTCAKDKESQPSNPICCNQDKKETCSCGAQAKPKVSNCPTCAKDATPKDKANEPCCLSQKDQTPSNPICCKQEEENTCKCNAQAKPKEKSNCPTCAKDNDSQPSNPICCKQEKKETCSCGAEVKKEESNCPTCAKDNDSQPSNPICCKQEKKATCSCGAEVKKEESNCPTCTKDKDSQPSNPICCKQEKKETCSCGAEVKKEESKCPTCAKDKDSQPCCLSQNDQKTSNHICCKQEKKDTCSCVAEVKSKEESKCSTCVKENSSKDTANKPCYLSKNDQKPSNPICCKQEDENSCCCSDQAKSQSKSKCPNCSKDNTKPVQNASKSSKSVCCKEKEDDVEDTCSCSAQTKAKDSICTTCSKDIAHKVSQSSKTCCKEEDEEIEEETCSCGAQTKSEESLCQSCSLKSSNQSPKVKSQPNLNQRSDKQLYPYCSEDTKDSDKSKQSVSFKSPKKCCCQTNSKSESNVPKKNVCPKCSKNSDDSNASKVKLSIKLQSDKCCISISKNNSIENDGDVDVDFESNSSEDDKTCQACIDSDEEEISPCASTLTPTPCPSKNVGVKLSASNKGILKVTLAKPDCCCSSQTEQKPQSTCCKRKEESVCCAPPNKDASTMTKASSRYDVRTIQSTVDGRKKKKKCTCRSESNIRDDFFKNPRTSQSLHENQYPVIWF